MPTPVISMSTWWPAREPVGARPIAIGAASADVAATINTRIDALLSAPSREHTDFRPDTAANRAVAFGGGASEHDVEFRAQLADVRAADGHEISLGGRALRSRESLPDGIPRVVLVPSNAHLGRQDSLAVLADADVNVRRAKLILQCVRDRPDRPEDVVAAR